MSDSGPVPRRRMYWHPTSRSKYDSELDRFSHSVAIYVGDFSSFIMSNVTQIKRRDNEVTEMLSKRHQCRGAVCASEDARTTHAVHKIFAVPLPWWSREDIVLWCAAQQNIKILLMFLGPIYNIYFRDLVVCLFGGWVTKFQCCPSTMSSEKHLSHKTMEF